MTFFESVLVLLLVAVVLLQISRRLSIPYPSMLAMAGAAVALVPGAPTMRLEPDTALALFIAPALMDCAFDFPIGTARRFWVPLLVFAVGAVLITTGLVAWAGWALAGLPLAAAIVLGAIVAPPDAAAATAILSSMAIPRSTDAVLRGESLFNDATALLVFGTALAVQSAGGIGPEVALRLGLAIPGGIVLGVLSARLIFVLNRFVTGTLGGILLQFVYTMLLWVVAQRLGFSPVLSIVAFAMTAANRRGTTSSVVMRVHSYPVWTAVVFVLNVLAFLIMGMQARSIVADMAGPNLRQAVEFAGIVVAIVIVSRIVLATGFNRAFALYWRRTGQPERAKLRQAVLTSWCGMRGLVTLATAFALPPQFPQRNLVVLTAFGVVFATLVVQGLTLRPVIRLLGLDLRVSGTRELAAVKGEIAAAALATLNDAQEEEAQPLKVMYGYMHSALLTPQQASSLDRYRAHARAAVAAQRDALERARAENRINVDEYNGLLQDIDWRELVALPDDGARIEES